MSSELLLWIFRLFFLNVHCCHEALRIEYAACIFSTVIISRPDAFFFLLVKQSVLAYVIFTNYSPVASLCMFSPAHANKVSLRWCLCVCCVHTFRTLALHMCGKTYYRCHHLFNKQFGSWFLQWIANGAAATKFKSPVWFMAALLEPHLIGSAYILHNQISLSCWKWLRQVDLITSEVFCQARAWSYNGLCSS